MNEENQKSFDKSNKRVKELAEECNKTYKKLMEDDTEE